MADSSCDHLMANTDDIEIIKEFLRKAPPNCRGISINNHIHRLLDEIISLIEDGESKGQVISKMNTITQLLQDPEIAELLRSVTYGKFHSKDILRKAQDLKETNPDLKAIDIGLIDKHDR